MPLHLDAERLDDPNDYVGRPSVSPALAGLVAAGTITKAHRVLDVGCGRGTDLLALAEHGFRKLEGLDVNRASLRAARAAERRRLGRAVVRWHWDNVADGLDAMPAGRFDWVLDTFLVNNLYEDEEADYLRRVARVLRRGGRLLSQCKVRPRAWSRSDAPRHPAFRAGPVVLTHLPEGRGRWRTHEATLVSVLTRR